MPRPGSGHRNGAQLGRAGDIEGESFSVSVDRGAGLIVVVAAVAKTNGTFGFHRRELKH